MALRILLVSLVACLGLELPTGQDFASWTGRGRDWASSRLAEVGQGWWDRLEPVSRQDAPRVHEPPCSTADLAFEVVVEGMASSFAADLKARRIEIEIEPSSPAETTAEVVREDREADDESAPVADRGDRLSTAVRLTRQAVQAWSSWIQGAPEGRADSY